VNQAFGPWATLMDGGSNAQLGRFWRRRLARLPDLSPGPAKPSWRVALALSATALVVAALPTLQGQAISGEPGGRGAQAPSPSAENRDQSPIREIAVPPVTVPRDYRIEPPDVLAVEIMRWPGGKVVRQGQYLVGPDGTINLSRSSEAYEAVSVAGLTGREAERQIVKTVSRKGSGGEFSARVEVVGFHSKVAYVIVSGNSGDCAYRLPVNDSSTLASAILQIDGLAARAAEEPVWLVRRTGDATAFKTEVKQIDWPAIVARGSVKDNVPLMPGDRIFVGGVRPREEERLQSRRGEEPHKLFTNLGNGVGVPIESIREYATAQGITREEARIRMRAASDAERALEHAKKYGITIDDANRQLQYSNDLDSHK